jgi:uncharacterized protein YjbI with pentapeptide repeats
MSLLNVLRRVLVFRPSGRRVSSMKPFLYGLVVLGLFLGTAGLARADFIYWSDGGTSITSDDGAIRRANFDGTGQTTLLSDRGGPVGPALDLAGGQMYWANVFGGNIRRANLDGSGQATLVSGLQEPGPPVLDLVSGHIYWPEGGFSGNFPGAIRRANLDGTGLTTVESGLDRPRGIALDVAGGRMYWTDNGSGDIRRANLDGTDQTTIVSGLSGPNAVGLDIVGGKLYWTNEGSADIKRANLDGTGQEFLIQNLAGPAGIALDIAGGLMYWTDGSGGDIRRANLDGTGQQTLVAGLIFPVGLTLDLGAPGTAVFFAVAGPASVPAGTPFDITVTALDPYGNVDVNYQGTVTFSTSDTDPGIVLPADFTFTADDAGVHTFSGATTLSTPGDQTITVTDTASGISRAVTVTVVPPN